MQCSKRFVASVVSVHLLALVSACSVGNAVATAVADIGVGTEDVYCDRRFVSDGKEPAPFCQEVIDTLAASYITSDCRERHAARADHGRCPRERVVAGCQLAKKNDDGSKVWDWYYDVSDLETSPNERRFREAILTKERVREMCADRKRYEDGASYADAP